MIGNKVVYFSFELAEGRTDELVKLLWKQGKRVEIQGDQMTVRFSDRSPEPERGFTCGLLVGANPVDQAQSLMFALFGPNWPLGLGKDYTEAQKQITAELKRRRERKEREKRLRPSFITEVKEVK